MKSSGSIVATGRAYIFVNTFGAIDDGTMHESTGAVPVRIKNNLPITAEYTNKTDDSILGLNCKDITAAGANC